MIKALLITGVSAFLTLGTASFTPAYAEGVGEATEAAKLETNTYKATINGEEVKLRNASGDGDFTQIGNIRNVSIAAHVLGEAPMTYLGFSFSLVGDKVDDPEIIGMARGGKGAFSTRGNEDSIKITITKAEPRGDKFFVAGKIEGKPLFREKIMSEGDHSKAVEVAVLFAVELNGH